MSESLHDIPAETDRPCFLVACLGSYAFLGGLVTLLGWFAHVPVLTDWLGAGIAMFANSALAATCAGAALLLRLGRTRSCAQISMALGVLVAVLGACTLAENISGLNLGIDTLLAGAKWGFRAAAAPGRMGPPASLSFTLLGTALALLAGGKRSRAVVPTLAIAVCVIGTLALIGYLFEAPTLYATARVTGVALQTASILLALAVGILASAPSLEPMQTLRDPSPVGLLTRRSLVLIIGLPVLFGWLAVRAEKAGWIDAGMETALVVMGLIAVLCGVLWWCVDSLKVYQRTSFENQKRLASMAAVVECSDDAIVTKNLQGIITSWNNGAQRLFGYGPHEVIGKSVTILIPAGRENEEPSILSRLQRGERIDHYETIRRRKDGTMIDISLTVSPIRGPDGTIIGASKIARDVTELRRARAALAKSHDELEERVKERTASLEQAIAQMEEFSYSVSHDLRAPVRAMRGYAQAVLDDYGKTLDARGRDYLERILRGGTRMEQLIHDVLTYSRLARTEIRTKPVSLQKLVHEVIQQYPEMQPPNAEISIKEPLAEVLGHEPSLTQIVSNLLANGVKFVARGTLPRIELWTEANNGSVRLWVEDNGIGIKPKYQHRLFGMFERVHQHAEYEGTGIGLAIVRKAAEKMGGKVGVESDGMTGTKFWVELPAAHPS